MFLHTHTQRANTCKQHADERKIKQPQRTIHISHYYYYYFSVSALIWFDVFSFVFFFSLSLSPYFSSTPTTKINGQTTPLDVTGLSQNEIQALLLGSHPSTQNISVKREPEDLRKDPKCTRNQKVMRTYLQSYSDMYLFIRFYCVRQCTTLHYSPQRFARIGAPVNSCIDTALKTAIKRVWSWSCYSMFTSMLNFYWVVPATIAIWSHETDDCGRVHVKNGPKNDS